MASHRWRRCLLRLPHGSMASRWRGPHGDLGRRGAGGRRGGSLGKGGRAGPLYGGKLGRRWRSRAFARKAGDAEQSSRQQQTGARHAQKPRTPHDSRDRSSEGASRRHRRRAAELAGRPRIHVDLLLRLDSLTFRPPDQVFWRKSDGHRRAGLAVLPINATAFAGPHVGITSEPPFSRQPFTLPTGGMTDHQVRGY